MPAEIRRAVTLAVRDLRRAWLQLLITDVAYKIVAFTVLLPLAGLTLQVFLALSGNSVVADEDILRFALSPVGLLGLLTAAVLMGGIVAFEQACLMTIGFAAAHGRRLGFVQALSFAGRRAVPVLLVAAQIVVRTLLLAAPFLAAATLIYLRTLSEFDINYYLTERPAAFRTAALLVGGVLGLMALVVIPRMIGWILALPLVLFEGTPAWRALAISRQRTHEYRWRIRVVVLAWGGAGLLASVLPSALVRGIGRIVVTPELLEQTDLLMFYLGALVVFWALSSLAVTLLNAVSFGLLAVQLHQTLGGSAGAEVAWAMLEARPRMRWSAAKVLVGLVALGLASGVVGALLLDDIDVGDADIAVIAHRGASLAAPENTLAAVERAILDGADWVEIDVQEIADGEVVVIHDRDLMKVAGVNLKVRDATLEQLREIDVGSHFAPEFADQRVPTLEEVLRVWTRGGHDRAQVLRIQPRSRRARGGDR